MATSLPEEPRYTPEEVARRAAQIFDQTVVLHITSEHPRKFVALDTELSDVVRRAKDAESPDTVTHTMP